MFWDECHSCGSEDTVYECTLEATGGPLKELKMPAKFCEDCFNDVQGAFSPPTAESGSDD